MNKVTIQDIKDKKKTRSPITMLTAYDYPSARLIDNAGVDIILVGDSLANVVLGLDSTKSVTMSEMLHHTKAARRAVNNALFVGDMPFESYQLRIEDSVHNARRFIDEAGCDAVKLEWFDRCPEVTERIRKEGIAVMGHIGLTPQTVDKIGGFKVQGKDVEAARRLIEEALLLEKLGVFSIVLECIPEALGEVITEQLKVPTIGIGAGRRCDGQVLVTHDILGLYPKHRPRFVKQYINLSDEISDAVRLFKAEVEKGTFPAQEHCYSMPEAEAEKLRGIKL